MIFHWLNSVDFDCVRPRFLSQNKTKEAAQNSSRQDWREHLFFKLRDFAVPSLLSPLTETKSR